MTNEAFWEKPEGAVYVGSPVSKVGIAVIIIAACLVYARVKSAQKICRQPVAAERQTSQNQALFR